MYFDQVFKSLIGIFVFAAHITLSLQDSKPFIPNYSLEIEEPNHDDGLDVKNLTESIFLNATTKQLPPPHGGHSCYPSGTNGVTQYLIGYGSLMQQASKDRTHPNTGENIPIRVYGFERSWTCKGDSISYSTTYLGADVSTNKSTYFNAVYFRVPSAAALANYDTRESFYCREEVLMSRIQLLATNSVRTLPSGQYWLYVTRPEFRETPTEEYPIVQSYADTFLSGCLELEEKYNLPGYAEECVFTTTDWENPWKNDRIFPRRPFMHQPMAGRIDNLLNRTVHDAFRSIQIEG